MKYHVIYVEKSLINLIWITEASIQQNIGILVHIVVLNLKFSYYKVDFFQHR